MRQEELKLARSVPRDCGVSHSASSGYRAPLAVKPEIRDRWQLLSVDDQIPSSPSGQEAWLCTRFHCAARHITLAMAGVI